MSQIDSKSSQNSLFVDIGNTSLKLGYCSSGSWKVPDRDISTTESLIQWLLEEETTFNRIVVASVRKDLTARLQSAITEMEIVLVNLEGINHQRLNYDTPQTLGIDRYLGCLGAWYDCNQPVVVIDSGTACTLDYMDAEGIYQGGVIMPGITVLQNAFNDFAPELPLSERIIPSNWPGKNTAESLQWGQFGLYLDGVRSILARYQKHQGDFRLYLTGGDAKELSRHLNIPCKRDPFLIFKGMVAYLKER